MVLFTDDAWPDGEERTYLTWDYVEVPGLYLTLRIEEGENTEFVEKCRLLGNCSLNMMFERERMFDLWLFL